MRTASLEGALIAPRSVGALLHFTAMLLLASVGGMRPVELLAASVWSLVPWFAPQARSTSSHWSAPVLAFILLATTLLAFVTGSDAPIALKLNGMLTLLAGAALRIWAFRSLGEGYSDGVTPIVPRVNEGAYRNFDHPGELGQLMLMAGGAMMLGAPFASMLVLALLLPLSFWRMHVEERAW